MTSAPPTPASNEKRFQAIEGRLRAIEQRLAPKPPNAFARILAAYWANKKSTLTVTALCLGVLSWFTGPLFKTWLDHRNDASNSTVDARIQASLSAPKGVLETLRDIQEKANATSTTLDTLKPFIQDVITHQFENVSKLPTQALVARAPALSDLAVVAKNQNVGIDPKIVAQTGAKLVAASGQKPALWDVVLKFVDYKSFNNSFFSFLPDTTNEPTFTDKYVINIPTSAHHPSISLKGKAPKDVAAQTGYIGQDRNKGLTSGPAWIVMESGEVGLTAWNCEMSFFTAFRFPITEAQYR